MEVKELGSTTVASELIPGVPDAIAVDAEATHDTSITLLDTYEAIKVIDTPSWSGGGAEAFWEVFTPEAERWHEARLATLHVKRALHDYADAVRTAQRHAEEAIAQWALADVTEAEAAAVSEAAQPSDPNVTVTATPPPPDPASVAAPYREEAQAILQHAREQLAQAAQTTAETIAAESGTGDDAPAWLVTAAVAASQHLAEHGEASVSRTEGQFLDGSVAEGEFGEQQPVNPDDAPSVTATLAEWDVSVEANLFETSADGSVQLGDVTLEGSVEASVGAEAGAGLTVSSDGVEANAHAGVEVRVDAEGSVTVGGVEASASASASAGAEAEASLSLGPDGLQVEGGAFAGAALEGAAQVEAAGVTVGANGELRAGVGAEGSVELSFDDGRFVVGGEVAAVLGVGGEWGWEITVDVDELNESILEYVNDGGIVGRIEEILDGPFR